jgi:hypothetical protein
MVMNVCPVNSKTLRQLWFVVEQTQTSTLLGLGDTDLVKQLLEQLDKKALSSEETNTMRAYISSKTSLIRDLALARLA